MSSECLDLVVRSFPEQRIPLAGAPGPWFVLLELSDHESEDHAREQFECILGAALASGEIGDAAIAETGAQSEAFWRLRESITLGLAQQGKCIKHDISVPTSRLVHFVAVTDEQLQRRFPGIRNMTFGHLGDGNLHYNLIRASDQSEEEFMARHAEITRVVHDSVEAHGGSISAEQGVGQQRVEELPRYKDAVELALMRRIKRALDPSALMNPGKVVPDVRPLSER
jgi:FAD/FMN-containing dehydrogenase